MLRLLRHASPTRVKTILIHSPRCLLVIRPICPRVIHGTTARYPPPTLASLLTKANTLCVAGEKTFWPEIQMGTIVLGTRHRTCTTHTRTVNGNVESISSMMQSSSTLSLIFFLLSSLSTPCFPFFIFHFSISSALYLGALDIHG